MTLQLDSMVTSGATTPETDLSDIDIEQTSFSLRTAVLGVQDTSSQPNWVYGTTDIVKSQSRDLKLSGLCLSERGRNIPVVQPEVIQNILYPISTSLESKITSYRGKLNQLLNYPEKEHNQLLIITGPSHITSATQVKACSQWIGSKLGKKFPPLPNSIFLPENVRNLYSGGRHIHNSTDGVFLSVRANLNHANYETDTYISERSAQTKSVMSFEIEHGIPVCRALLCELAEICPIVGQISDTITPQFFSDLFCLGLVNSSLVESQLHREIVSGVSYPVGFETGGERKDSVFDREIYTHKIDAALNAMFSSSNPHQFLSITKIGNVAVIGTTGNDDTFIVLEADPDIFIKSKDIIQFIDIIYNYSNFGGKPRIMLNVGTIKDSNYDAKFQLLNELLLNETYKKKLIGVMIDSGKNYLPQGYDLQFRNSGRGGELERQSSLRHLKSDFTSHDAPTQSTDGYYECFINADKFINQLVDAKASFATEGGIQLRSPSE